MTRWGALGLVVMTACPPPHGGGFSLSAGARADLLSGFGGPLAVSIARRDGFAGSVTLSLQSPPAGIGASPVTVTGTGTGGILQIQVDSAIPQGNRTLTVLGEASSGSSTVDVPVLVRGASGGPDESFGNGGVSTLPTRATGDVARAIATQPDGRLLVAGYTNGDHAQMELARFWPDGGLEDQVFVDFCGTADVGAFALAATPDSVFLVGDTKCPGPIAMAIAKLHSADLSLDTRFGATHSGEVTLPVGMNDSAYAVVVQPDGKIVIGGSSLTDAWDLALVRLNPEGQLDSTFGDGGVVKTRVGSGATGAVRGLVLRSDGSLVAAGTGGDLQTSVVAAYDGHGALLPSFASGGLLVGSLGGVSTALAITQQSDGQLIVGGTANNGSNVFEWMLGRYSPTGVADPSFGTAGLVTQDFGSLDQEVVSLAATDAGLYAGGYLRTAATGYDFAVTRYRPDGTPDQTFGSGGTRVMDFDGGDDFLYGLTVDSLETVVVAGQASGPAGTQFGLQRLWQ